MRIQHTIAGFEIEDPLAGTRERPVGAKGIPELTVSKENKDLSTAASVNRILSTT